MSTKELKIEVPKGYEIDRKNSTFECIKFKPIELTYKDVAEKLFMDKKAYMVKRGCITSFPIVDLEAACDINNSTSLEQVQKLMAINKLMNVAKYLNGNWKPDWDNPSEVKWSITLDFDGRVLEEITTNNHTILCEAPAFFPSKELAEQAIKILGEGTIKLALSTDW